MTKPWKPKKSRVRMLLTMFSPFAMGDVVRRLYTFHRANTTVTLTELEVRRVEYFEGDRLTMTAAFVYHFCTHDCELG